MNLPASGSCQCGKVKYEISEEPIATVVCHCRDCQKLSTATFSITMILRRSGLKILTGELKSWERPTAAGGTSVNWFCPVCSNRIYHENPDIQEFIRFKPGTLDDTSQIKPQAHVWTCREQPWLAGFSELPKIETQPDIPTALAAIARGESPF